MISFRGVSELLRLNDPLANYELDVGVNCGAGRFSFRLRLRGGVGRLHLRFFVIDGHARHVVG